MPNFVSSENLYKLCETLSKTNSQLFGPSCKFILCYETGSFSLCVTPHLFVAVLYMFMCR